MLKDVTPGIPVEIGGLSGDISLPLCAPFFVAQSEKEALDYVEECARKKQFMVQASSAAEKHEKLVDNAQIGLLERQIKALNVDLEAIQKDMNKERAANIELEGLHEKLNKWKKSKDADAQEQIDKITSRMNTINGEAHSIASLQRKEKDILNAIKEAQEKIEELSVDQAIQKTQIHMILKADLIGSIEAWKHLIASVCLFLLLSNSPRSKPDILWVEIAS